MKGPRVTLFRDRDNGHCHEPNCLVAARLAVGNLLKKFTVGANRCEGYGDVGDGSSSSRRP